MITESDITLYSKGFDKDTRTDIWTRYEINDVHWEEVKGINVLNSGLTSANSVEVFIPLTSLDGTNIPRIKADDYIVKDIVKDEIRATSEIERKYNSAVKVKSVDYRTDSIIKSLWHIEVGCE